MRKTLTRAFFCGSLVCGAVLTGCTDGESMVVTELEAMAGQAVTVDLLAPGSVATPGCEIQVDGLPDGSRVEGRWLSWTPEKGQTGAWELFLTHSDGCSGSDLIDVVLIRVGEIGEMAPISGKEAPPESGSSGNTSPTSADQVHDFEASQTGN